MRSSRIVGLRLLHQQLARQTLADPAALVRWFGAVQAQDYPASKWAVGQRLKDGTARAVEQALACGSILRTHVLRPTWHFVSADDIRWMLSLTAPRILAALASYDRQLELDPTTLSRSRRVLAGALRGGRMLTRAELGASLQKAGIDCSNGQRLGQILAHAELTALVCSGAPRGSRQTYALLDERAPSARDLPRVEALAALAARYFSSHGPAMLEDYAWWSGLTRADAREGIALISDRLESDTVAGRTIWWSSDRRTGHEPTGGDPVHLLPAFDEYLVGYGDRSAALRSARGMVRPNAFLGPAVLVGGCVVGAWKRTIVGAAIRIAVAADSRLTVAAKRAISAAADRYGRFHERAVGIEFGLADSHRS